MSRLVRLGLLIGLLAIPAGLYAEEPVSTKAGTEQTAIQADQSIEDAGHSSLKSYGSEKTDVKVVLALGENTATAQYGCCKICRVGKACGDTCISRYKTCHVGPGCACDAN